MIRVVGLPLAVVLTMVWTAAAAQADAALMRLHDLLAVDEYMAIIRSEGLADADEVSQDMLGRPADPGFLDQLEQVNDPARMRETVLQRLEHLSEAEIAASVAFFQTDVALRITELELAARRAMADEEVEQAARDAWERAQEARPDLVARIDALSDANDLVERNVAGALTSNLRFYQGLADGDGLDMTEEEILTQVRGQEADLRADTVAWLGGFSILAYDSLPPAEMEAYLAFWKTPAGQALNAAIFDGFNQLYDDISYATGRVVALHMGTQDL